MNDARNEEGRSMSRGPMILVGGLAVLGLVAGVQRYFCRDECCARTAATTTIASATLSPDQTIDPAFEGCRGTCGSHAPEMSAIARAQPGAATGDVVHCPVSGAVFRVKEGAAVRVLAGKSLYFCCAACAGYFDAHRAEILAKRGMPAT